MQTSPCLLDLVRAHSIIPILQRKDQEPEDRHYPKCISLGAQVCVTAANKVSYSLKVKSLLYEAVYKPFQDNI
jgi:hypothetical protein